MSGRGSAPACMKVFSLWSASPIGPMGADLLEVHQDICPTWRRLALEIQPEMNSANTVRGSTSASGSCMIPCTRVAPPPLHRRKPVLSAQLAYDMLRQLPVDFAVSRDRLRRLQRGVRVPVVPPAISRKYAAEF